MISFKGMRVILIITIAWLLWGCFVSPKMMTSRVYKDATRQQYEYVRIDSIVRAYRSSAGDFIICFYGSFEGKTKLLSINVNIHKLMSGEKKCWGYA